MRFASSSFGRVIVMAALLLPAAPLSALADARSAAAARAVVPGDGVRVLASRRTGSVKETIDALERAGYHVDVAVLPETFFVRAGRNASSLPSGFDDATLAGAAGPVAAVAPGEAMPDLFGGLSDVLPPASGHPRSVAERLGSAAPGLPKGLPYGTRWRDTSELMIGRVAVPLLFPESDGSADPNHYDWTPALRDSVVRSAVRGFLKWTAIANARGVPLTFLIEVHAVAPTRYEPIDRTIADEHLWIEETLEPLVGYKGDAVAMAYDVANAARARLGTHWAALLMAVQNDADPDGKFADGIGEHAMLGGPYFVVMVKQSNFGSASLDFYIEHEVTHMFWALDEYPASNAWWACSWMTGYFNQPNTNADVPAPGYCYGNPALRRQCFMKGNYPDSLCPSTERQVGWVDLDQDGTLDLYETRPIVIPDSTHYFASTGVTIPVRGVASDAALPNRNPYYFGAGDSITIATVDSIWQRLDGGPWVSVVAEDGIFDEGSERFLFTLASPAIGNHLLEFQAHNTNGRTMAVPASAVITVTGGATGVEGPSGDPGPAIPSLTAGPTPSAGAVQFSLRGRGDATATARIYDVTGRVVQSWSFALPPSGSVGWTWDGRSARGGTHAAGLYFVVVQWGAERLTRRIVLVH